MIVYKFGGASVRSAEGIRNIASIISEVRENLFIVISAMGKTTNAMEAVLEKFMKAEKNSALSLFTMTNNFALQVIEGKDERGHLAETEGFDNESIEAVLSAIESAPELSPLNRDEFKEALSKIVLFHSRAFDWKPNINQEELCEKAWSCGYYLRTKIRAAIEYLDQLLQYGDMGVITAGELEQETYDEEIPLPEEL